MCQQLEQALVDSVFRDAESVQGTAHQFQVTRDQSGTTELHVERLLLI
jgi:hypothetical protein